MGRVESAVQRVETSELDRELARVARSPVLLIASDYDGTIAPIVSDPSAAHPHREAAVALRSLSMLPQTHVAVISGRALRDLAALTGLPDEVHLVGSHGSEFDLDFAGTLHEDASALRERVRAELAEIARSGDGLFLEVKPASIAFHYRNADAQVADRALQAVERGPALIEGVVTRHGKKVIELGVVATNKGDALATIRRRVGAAAVVFFGDDRTDEDAFATLAGPDVGVKVGEGESIARYRLGGPHDVARALARIAMLRAEWLEGVEAVPIEQHSLLSDLRALALVTPAASVTWLCAPSLDSSALFASLLGGPAAGHFTIAPVDERPAQGQRYLGDTLILETSWRDLTVTDCLDCSGGRPTQRAGRSDLLRTVTGTGKVRIEFAPRLDFGRTPTRVSRREGGLVVEGTFEPIVLRGPGLHWQISREGLHDTAVAEVELADESITLELVHGSGALRAPHTLAPTRMDETHRLWSEWAESLTLPSVQPELVKRSALLIKGLCHGPTGGIAAAGTTSLPEHIGGVRNWDYRYCWLRDAAMAAAALVKLGSTTEAMRFLDWMLGVLDECGSPEYLQPLYTVAGRRLGPEGEISELAGYCGSRPVRVGNAASSQVQLDVFGPIVDLVAALVEANAPLSGHHWRLVEAMVSAVSKRWREPDHGIWEIRKPPRHHVHSKTMCWLTVDRAIAIAERFLDLERPEWVRLRADIAADVIEHGFDAAANSFTAAYDGDDLDASALLVGLSGLVQSDDDRFVGTVAAVESRLLEGGVVYRYLGDDGLPGFEGGFHLCTSWLIESYIRLGRVADARSLFDQFAALAGPTGALSEQYGGRTGRALGNVPQAYSHTGLIENAISLGRLQ